MNIITHLFPGGRNKALTMSYDDGVTADRKLIDIFNANSIRGSWHINAGLMGQTERLPAGEIAKTYAGHEVSCHGLKHPWLNKIPLDQVANEIVQDRRILEDLVGYPVRGMSYPYGAYDARVVAMLPSLGIEYSRTTYAHYTFALPESFLTWPATCHHRNRLAELSEKFLAVAANAPASLLYVWGHAYEFDRANNWELIEQFCRGIGGKSDIWYATNIEIFDYLTAARALRFSADATMVFNPSALSVWFRAGEQAIQVNAGQTLRLP